MPNYVTNVKLCNFLSFFGQHEISLEPFAAIACHFHQGKKDFLSAMEFVFGAGLGEIGITEPIELVTRVLQNKWNESSETECYVAVTLSQGDFNRVFLRGINKNGNVEYKIDDRVVSILRYRDALTELNVNIRNKNLIVYQSYFNDIIWGSPQEFEMAVTSLLRKNCVVNEWQSVSEKVKHLLSLRRTEEEINYHKIKTEHETLEYFADAFDNLTRKLKNLQSSFHEKESSSDEVEESTSSELSTSSEEEWLAQEVVHKQIFVQNLEEKLTDLQKKYHDLTLKGNCLQCELHHREIKFASKPVNASILQQRIAKLKARLRVYESELSSLWKNFKEMELSLSKLSDQISFDMAALSHNVEYQYQLNRYTKYGRFVDYLQSSTFTETLSVILGKDILYGNFCDHMDEALICLQYLQEYKCEVRETFIVFDQYSTKLKDLLVASGEKGIEIRNIQDLQIFLCKLKQYGLLESVPVVVRNSFNFDVNTGKDYDVIYPEDHVYLSSDGTIIYYAENDAYFQVEEVLVDRIKQSLEKQELKYQEYSDLHFKRWETLQLIYDVENDISHLTFHFKGNRHYHSTEPEITTLSSDYDEYIHFFREHEENLKNMQEELQEAEENLFISSEYSSSDSSKSSSEEDSGTNLSSELEYIENEKMKLRNEYAIENKNLRVFTSFSDKIWFRPMWKSVNLAEARVCSIFYFEIELRKIKRLMAQDDIIEFNSWKDWRKEVINTLVAESENSRNLLKTLKKELNSLTEIRKTVLSPFLQHCSLHLSSAFNLLMDTALPFLHLNMTNSDSGLQLFTSLNGTQVNILEIVHCNTFIRFVAALTLIIELALYDTIPLLFLDDTKDFFPVFHDNFEAVLSEDTLRRITNTTESVMFQILMRIGQYLHHITRKNSEGNTIRSSGKPGTKGAIQIVYFTSSELVHAAQSHIWIRSNILPEDVINKDCNSYSLIENLRF